MYSLRYDPTVLKKDLKKIDRPIQKEILFQIQKKLTQAPLEYGKPLHHSLKGYLRLRVGDYRVIYEVNAEERLVTIWMIAPRKDDLVYLEFLKKLQK